MTTVSLYFIAVTKLGDVLFVESGPYKDAETAQDMLKLTPQPDGACSLRIIKVELPCEFEE